VARPVDEILQMLRDDNEETRHSAVQRLEAFGDEALPHLGEALGDRSWRVRKAALEVVLKIPGSGRMGLLLEGIRDDDNAGRRNTCMEALVRLGAAAIPSLPQLIEDEDPDVRKFGVDILGSIDDVKVFQPLLEALEDREDNVAAAAAEYLGRKKHGPAVPSLVQGLDGGGFWMKYSCIRALGEIGDPSAGDAVLRLAGEKGLRKVALEALGMMGTGEAEPFILKGLQSEDRGLRKIAVLAAARLDRRRRRGGEDGTAFRAAIRENAGGELVEYLRGLIGHDDTEIRRAAMAVLGAAAGRGAIDPLLEILPGLEEEEQTFIAEVLEGLPEKELEDLVPKLRSGQAAVRRWVAAVLGRRRSRGAVPSLVGLLEDENGHVRSEAAGALGEIGEEIAVAPLLSLLSDPYPDVRQSAVDALRNLGGRGEELRRLVLSFLESHLDSPDQDIVANALRIVAGLGSREVMGRLTFALKDERSQVRRAAVEALGSLEGPEATEVLRLALTDEDAAVRREAVQKLGESGRAGTLPFLLPMLRDEDLWVRVRAVQAVAGQGSEEARAVLVETVEREDAGPVRLAAIRALGGAKSDKAGNLLLSLARSADRESRAAAIEALGRLGGKEAVAVLLDCLGDGDWSIRSATVKSLASSAAAKDVRSRLETVAREDGDPMVRAAAAGALGEPRE
jgi:HEAT repeat protein